MRSKEEIIKIVEPLFTNQEEKMKIELLLDIRRLLEDIVWKLPEGGEE